MIHDNAAPEHSPLPWRVDADEPSIDVVDSKGRSVCEVDPNGNVTQAEGEANAALIVRAVNRDSLFEEVVGALEELSACWLDYHDRHNLTEPVTGRSANAFDRARSILSKIKDLQSGDS